MERERERDSLSSDEDDDHQSLVRHNGTSPRLSSAFEIADSPSRTHHRRFSSCPRRPSLILSISIPFLLAIILILSFSLRPSHPSLSPFSPADLMRDSQLRALSLLRDQHSLLLRSWNLPLPPDSTPDSNAAPTPSSPDSTPILLQHYRSAILKQITLNQQIQNALLSSHRPTTANTTDPDTQLSLPSCQKLERSDVRRAIEWHPRKDRYLFAICLSGQMSNRLICLEKHMFVAALLDRALVLPSPKFDYDYQQVLDVNNINECFGRKVVWPYAEFAEMNKGKVKIDRFICYIASPPCYLDDDHIKKLKGVGVSVGKIEAAWPEDAKLKTQKKRVSGDVTGKFASNDEVIAVGDMFYADLEEEWVMQPGGPLAHKCKTVIQPSRLIILTAQRFVQTFLGNNFVALHFRRHGFLKFCNLKKESCFFPIPQAAECILRVIERANAPVVYLSTDAAASETDLLQSLVLSDDRQVPLVKRPGHNPAEKWDALLIRNHLGGDQVEAMLDKTICAMASVFIGSSGSTFTDDILRLRRGWGSASHCDEYLCQGEQPNYIADLQ